MDADKGAPRRSFGPSWPEEPGLGGSPTSTCGHTGIACRFLRTVYFLRRPCSIYNDKGSALPSCVKAMRFLDFYTTGASFRSCRMLPTRKQEPVLW